MCILPIGLFFGIIFIVTLKILKHICNISISGDITMAVPKRKTSKARRNGRSSTWGIKPKAFASCSNCDAALMPHQACDQCGFYKGSKVMKTKNDRMAKRTELKQAKEARQKTAKQDAPVEAEIEETKEEKSKK